jgi:ribonuclease M5
MSKINTIFIVEGKHDYSKIKSVNKDAFILTTNGLDISSSLINRLKILSSFNRLVLFCDNDETGLKIRKRLLEKISFEIIDIKEENVCVEDLTSDEIRLLLKDFFQDSNHSISREEFLQTRLLYSKENRNHIVEKFNFEKGSFKLFFSQLNMFQLTKKDIEEIIKND